jgi:hypothetical protein
VEIAHHFSLLVVLYCIHRFRADQWLVLLIERDPVLAWAILATVTALTALGLNRAQRANPHRAIELSSQHDRIVEQVTAECGSPDAPAAMCKAAERGLEAVRGVWVRCTLSDDRRPLGLSAEDCCWRGPLRTGQLTFTSGDPFSAQDVLAMKAIGLRIDVVMAYEAGGNAGSPAS